MNNKRISVAMATYNGERYIKQQIKSILANLKANDELIISDDGSTDHTIEIINSIGDNRIKLIEGPKNGIKKNFENAIKNTAGDYIFLSDQDDLWMPNKVEKVLKIFEKSDYILIQHDAIVIDGNENVIIDSFAEHRKVKTGIIKNLIKNSYHGCCIAFKKELKKEILPIPDKIYLHDQWIGMIAEANGKTFFLDEKLIKYRRYENNNSSFTHLPFQKMLMNRVGYFKEFVNYLNVRNFLKKENIEKNIIYIDKENKKIITILKKHNNNLKIYFDNDIYSIIDFKIKRAIKNKFIKNKMDRTLKINYLYFINNYYNRFPYYYYNQIMEIINNGKEINIELCEEFLSNNRIKYKFKKNIFENINALKERIKIILNYIFITKKKAQNEILNYCKENKIEKFIYHNNTINMLSGSIDAALYIDNEKRYFVKGYDIYGIYNNEAKILNRINKIDMEIFPKLIHNSKNYFVENFTNGITLDKYIEKNKIDNDFVERFKSFSIKCLDILYESKIIHRDLRPENIIVVINKNGEISFKLIDFGCSTMDKEDIFITKHKKNYRILDTIGEEYVFDKHIWDDAVAFLIIYEKIGIEDSSEIKQRVGRLVERI